ncbi:MAG: decaprenyl-phosphate phosphoribosyltransferase [Prevotella sp.]|nr:decaprenyl-phosphate phosphoribosyltransferase [Prevotella sp.]MBR1656618.1 decaprenyl-phosphate phosphoribosyltransferase [Prevotella sp.]MBR3389090.1 decaprenyl-phosphate phosphoribosyltransferase [Prevotella sp.]MBR3445744.1 decaprenyl-phosphate phosphoribosyltransferase [Prevotella sp.]MBR7013281.1 decaprenyl-phosphate phosphoribosyltransferase [Prevotella sp.]
MKDIIRLVRPKQWLKNVFVLIPVFFGGRLSDVHDLLATAFAFVAFSFAASSIYCFNDIIDADADRRHPVKCSRPVARGAVTMRQAYMLMAQMILLALCVVLCGRYLSVFTPSQALRVGGVIAGYWLLNLAYCAWLKKYAIVDVSVIAFGFVLRVLAGGFATDIIPSRWLVLMTFLLTLFLSLAKRRDDVLRMNATGEAPRTNTIRYNLTFINQAITITASITTVCYIMYTVSPEVIARFQTEYLYLTTCFVILGLLRYIQITVVDEQSGDPTKIMLRDRFMQAVVVLWAISFAIIIYL